MSHISNDIEYTKKSKTIKTGTKEGDKLITYSSDFTITKIPSNIKTGLCLLVLANFLNPLQDTVSHDSFYRICEYQDKHPVEGVYNVGKTSELSSSFNYTENAKVYVDNNLFLKPIINDIKTEIRKYFKSEMVSLDTICDPEDNSEVLFISVLSSEDVDIVHNKMDEFNDNWWIENLDRTKSKICIDVVFV